MKNKFVCLMPMAGKGVRFKNFRYNTPKPLIMIKNKPMFLQSAKTFSKIKEWVFVTSKNIFENKIFKKTLKHFKKKKVIVIKRYTKGQAISVLKGLKFIEKNKNIIIHSCDLNFNCNFIRVEREINKYDIIIFTTKSNKFHKKNHTQFSWVAKSNKSKNIEISLKKNFSGKLKKTSRVLVGSFVFKNKKILEKLINHIVKSNLKIKKEYYIDTAVAIADKLGFKVSEEIINKYSSWGTHKEVLIYNKI